MTDSNQPALHGAVPPAGQAPDTEDYNTTLTRARSAALTHLRRERRPEYDAKVAEYMAKAGYDYTPPLTPAERAKARIQALAEEHGLHVVVDPADPAQQS